MMGASQYQGNGIQAMTCRPTVIIRPILQSHRIASDDRVNIFQSEAAKLT
jgi:hypothetical protein